MKAAALRRQRLRAWEGGLVYCRRWVSQMTGRGLENREDGLMDALLGIDIGTSGAKAAVVDAAGRVLGVGRDEYGMAMPRQGWAEQDPAIWLAAAAATVQEALQR